MEFDWPDQKSFIQRHLLLQKRFFAKSGFNWKNIFQDLSSSNPTLFKYGQIPASF